LQRPEHGDAARLVTAGSQIDDAHVGGYHGKRMKAR
jgi:hypothetical protein